MIKRKVDIQANMIEENGTSQKERNERNRNLLLDFYTQLEDQVWLETPVLKHLQAIDRLEVPVMMSNQDSKLSCHAPCKEVVIT